MKSTALSIIRVASFLGISMVAFLGILSEPRDNSTTWFADFLIVKFIGGLALLLCIALYKNWSTTDKWFVAYDKWCKEAEETPNPMRVNYNNEED